MTAVARERTTAELLLEWDRRRARSQQRELGMSEVGGCRRRAGYRLAGVEPTNPGGSVQAVMGTAVHAAVESVHRDMQAAGLIPAEDLVEYEVRFAGVIGHLDRYVASSATLRDTKTTVSRWLEHIRIHGAEQSHVWQTQLYAGALIRAGKPVRRIVIDYLARDTGDDHQVEMRFDPQHVKAALNWLDAVRRTELEFLPRDHEPASSFCQHCPFLKLCWEGAVPDRDLRSVLYVENADARKWAEQLWKARELKTIAKKLEAEAKGALDALRPSDEDSATVDVGSHHPLHWNITLQRRLDQKAVRAEYARAGARPPMTESKVIKLEFAAPEPEDGA